MIFVMFGFLLRFYVVFCPRLMISLAFIAVNVIYCAPFAVDVFLMMIFVMTHCLLSTITQVTFHNKADGATYAPDNIYCNGECNSPNVQVYLEMRGGVERISAGAIRHF